MSTVDDVVTTQDPCSIVSEQHSIVLLEQNNTEEIALPILTSEEDAFALAIIEYGGNAAAAYCAVFGEHSRSPSAHGQAILARPHVRARIRELTAVVRESSLLTIGMHLQELAVIRDLAKMQGQLKVALQAERSRGEAVGVYDKFEHGNKANIATNIQINFVSKHDMSI